MKRIIFASLILFCLTVFAEEPWSYPPLLGNTRPPRVEKIGQKIVFRSSKKNTPVIVVPAGSPETVRFAAAELQSVLQKKLKRSIQIVPEPVKGKYPIILGINKFTLKSIEEKKLCRDAFFILITPEKTIIAGKDDTKVKPSYLLKKSSDHLARLHCFERATYFGVLDFLERFAGFRSYFPCEELTVVPEGELELPEAFIFERPDFEIRWHSPFNGLYDDPAQPGSHAKQSTPVKMLNWYRNRMQTRMIGGSHGLYHLDIYRRFAKTHPEYLAVTAQVDGKGKPVLNTKHFCYSNGLEKAVLEDAKAYFTGQPAQSRNLKRWTVSLAAYGCFSLTPSDALEPCRCSKCQKYFSQYDGRGGGELIWNFTLNIADGLKKAGIRGWVEQGIYDRLNNDRVPQRDIPDNVLLKYCHLGPWNINYKPGKELERRRLLMWYKKTGKPVILYNYALKWGGHDIPLLPDTTPRAIARYYKENAPFAYGAQMESGTDYYIFHYLGYYIYGKVCWNTKADADKLLAEHAKVLFGPAASQMMEFFDTLETLWLKSINAQVVMTAIGPRSGTADKKDLYEKLYSPGQVAKLRQLLDQSVKLCKKDKMQVRRIEFIRKNFLSHIEKGLKEYTQFGNARSEFGLEIPFGLESVKVDGKFDDAVWKNIPENFMQKSFASRNKKIPRSTFKVYCDSKNLYFAFDFDEPEYGKRKVSLPRTPDHKPWYDDGVEVFLMSDPLKKRYFHIVLNSAGAKVIHRWNRTGGKFFNDPPCRLVPETGVARSQNGWRAEVAVPLAQLEGFDGKILLANVCRHRRTTEETYGTWSPFFEKRGFHDIDNFGKFFFVPRNRKNLLINSDFAGKMRGPYVAKGDWNVPRVFKNHGKVSLDTERFVYGPNSLRIENVQKGRRTGVGQSLDGKLKPGTEYRLSFYAMCENIVPYNAHRTSGAWVGFSFGKGFTQIPERALTGTQSWRYYSFRFKTPADFKKGIIYLRMSQAAGAVNFDRVTIEEVKAK
ncbi:MAG: DUF4838 domain-containing protein [Lentisphaeria bacterium]|nr:DUF4838 domain-containing protein [Lentisphaeria bacterium]